MSTRHVRQSCCHPRWAAYPKVPGVSRPRGDRRQDGPASWFRSGHRGLDRRSRPSIRRPAALRSRVARAAQRSQSTRPAPGPRSSFAVMAPLTRVYPFMTANGWARAGLGRVGSRLGGWARTAGWARPVGTGRMGSGLGGRGGGCGKGGRGAVWGRTGAGIWGVVGLTCLACLCSRSDFCSPGDRGRDQRILAPAHALSIVRGLCTLNLSGPRRQREPMKGTL